MFKYLFIRQCLDDLCFLDRGDDNTGRGWVNLTMFLVDVDNIAGDCLAERSGVELEAIDLLDDLV